MLEPLYEGVYGYHARKEEQFENQKMHDRLTSVFMEVEQAAAEMVAAGQYDYYGKKVDRDDN